MKFLDGVVVLLLVHLFETFTLELSIVRELLVKAKVLLDLQLLFVFLQFPFMLVLLDLT